MTHWATQYIGLPWEYGAKGPEGYDCWGFTRHIQKEHFGISMPEIDYGREWHTAANNLQNHEERANWCRTAVAEEGDIVMMARSRLPIHIGVYITANRTPGILHCLQGVGVVFNPLLSLRSAGWGSLQYYRRASPCKN